jgi:hypothetical protein
MKGRIIKTKGDDGAKMRNIALNRGVVLEVRAGTGGTKPPYSPASSSK